jgi:magnesium-transporting ATPase (P-type)
VLIFILLAAAVVVAGLREWIEFGLILGVVTLNVLIGMVQEGKAEKAAEAIKAMLSSSGGREKAELVGSRRNCLGNFPFYCGRPGSVCERWGQLLQ